MGPRLIVLRQGLNGLAALCGPVPSGSRGPRSLSEYSTWPDTLTTVRPDCVCARHCSYLNFFHPFLLRVTNMSVLRDSCIFHLHLAWLDLTPCSFLSWWYSSVSVQLCNMHRLDHRKFDCTVMSQTVSCADWWGDGGTVFAVGAGRRWWQEGWQKLWETAVMP